MTRLLLALTAAAALSAAPSPKAADWPEFRGPTAQGIVTDGALPTEWSDTKNVLWKQPVPGKGWSSPVAAGGRIYLTTAASADGGKDGELSLQALCMDGETGATKWAREVFREGPKSPKPHSKNSHASPTPLVRGDRLYVHFGHMGTACLDLDGNIVWKNSDLRYAPVHGNGGSPVLVDGALIFSCDGSDKQFVAALDATDGHVLWKKDRDVHPFKGFSFGTPLVITVGDKKQVVSQGSNVVIAYDPKSGDEIWRVRYEGYSLVPRPVYGNGLLYLSTGFDAPKLLAIRPDGKGDVTDNHVAWTVEKNAPNSPSLLLLGDRLYMVSDHGILSCLDAKTGDEIWHERVGGDYSASPIAADGKIYLLSEDGIGVVVKAGDKFELVAKNPIKEKTLASYGVLDGSLLIRTETSLYRIGAK
jgi:outer membrane protein assembly factor BamB